MFNFIKQPGKADVLKRAISLLIALAMIITMLPIQPKQVQAGETANEVTVKLHYRNTKQTWNDVYAYSWTGEDAEKKEFSGGWPGAQLTKDNDGYYSYEVKVRSDKAFNYIINNGSGGEGYQTKDLSISASVLAADADGIIERWIDGAEKVYTSSLTGLPTVNGDKVTFTYRGTTGQNVYLAGTMNGWNSSVDKMTETSTGIYTIVKTLEPGEYQYKYVIKGTGESWVQDSNNNFEVIEPNGNKNSIAYVPGITGNEVSVKRGSELVLPSMLGYFTETGGETAKEVTYTPVTQGVTIDGYNVTLPQNYAEDTFYVTATTADNEVAQVKVVIYEPQPVTIKLYYDRADNKETEWSAWMWADNMGGKDYKLSLVGGKYVATCVVEAEDVPYVNAINFEMKRGDWLEKEGKRKIDISTVIGGTVNAYVNADGSFSINYDAAVIGTKLKKITYNRDDNNISIMTTGVISTNANDYEITKSDGSKLPVTSITQSGMVYNLELGEDISSLDKVIKSYQLKYDGKNYGVIMPNIYASDEFEEAYTYDGNDLGATWTEQSTIFKVWSPTADAVKVKLYATGSDAEEGSANLGIHEMEKGDKGVWSLEINDNLKSVYYTYLITNGNETKETLDPYARTTGVNGKRAMVIDLASTNPVGWNDDVSPNAGMTYTDAIIYELHVRDLSIDKESGIKDEWKGKFLGLTQSGTANSKGIPTGLDHIRDLGVTHIHLLPSYDFGSIDETMSEEEKAADPSKQFNWGYDPVNYNVPEGSYSTNPYDGNVRITEMKTMIQTLHKNNINVIMDVVYNHVQDAGTFSMNITVPNYFSRTNKDGSYSDGSGCGNDTASERAMVRKYIVDSVKYWADEYHIDGFRFDLVGLLDAETINQVVNEVHKTHPDVIFYGEGWDMVTAVEPSNTIMATQKNAWATPEFAYFSDTFRDFLKGNGGYGGGFVQNNSEADDPEGLLMECFTANTDWIKNPTQVINYASCHDNYTLMDKINLTKPNASLADRAKMNNLAAAIYLTAEGIPLIHAGEEILRTKVDNTGEVIHNSYKSPDYINSLKWGDLDSAQYQQVRDYYKGLIEFRKNHAALRLTTKDEVDENVESIWVDENVVMFKINGKNSVSAEVADEIVIIFNPNNTSKTFSIYEKGASTGTWNICVNDTKAGTDVLGTVTNGQVTVPAISALVLVKGKTVDENSIYNQVSVLDKGTVEVSYVDEKGNEIANKKTINDFVGKLYSTEAIEIEGYALVKKPSNANGRHTEEKINVVYVYTKKPTTISGFNYSARTYNTITLKWTKNTEVDGYKIEIKKNGAWSVAKEIAGNATTSYKVTGLSASTSYTFRITGYKNVIEGKAYGASVTKTVKTNALTNLSKATITLKQSSFGYTGNYIRPVVTVKVTVDGKTKTLTKGTDYTVTKLYPIKWTR